ncbi:MAG TPA: DUF494 family protein [Bacteroidota bacterium]|nr:DUF494 family protein [Bacteroidota bacterium]
MKERVVEILMYLMAEIEANKRLSEVSIEDLTSRGYTQSEISAAFSWLYDNMQVHEGRTEIHSRASTASRRQLHEAEKLVLSTEAQGYLMQLVELGILDAIDLEAVIERAMLTGLEKLSADEVRSIVASVIFGRPPRLQGGQSLPNNNETIH